MKFKLPAGTFCVWWNSNDFSSPTSDRARRKEIILEYDDEIIESIFPLRNTKK